MAKTNQQGDPQRFEARARRQTRDVFTQLADHILTKTQWWGFLTKPQTFASVWMVSLVRLVRTWILPSFLRNVHPDIVSLTESPQKPGQVGGPPNECGLCSIPIVSKNRNYNYKTTFLLKFSISGHAVSRQSTL